jgi:PAS domain S-box-containing protein
VNISTENNAQGPFPFDLTAVGEMGRRLAGFDSTQCLLGTAAEWPPGLTTALGIMLCSPSPMAVWWGKELVGFYNDACIPFLGRLHPDALGRSAREAWTHHWAGLGPRVDDVLTHGHAVRGEAMTLGVEPEPANDAIGVTCSLTPIFDAEGGVGGVCALVTSYEQRATVLKNVETEPPDLPPWDTSIESLLTSEAAYRDLYEHAPEMCCSVDAQSGLVVQCNQTLLDKTGFSREEVIGHPLVERYLPDCQAEAQAVFARIRTGGASRDAELRMRCKDGGHIDVSVGERSVLDTAGRILAFRLILRDVTDRRRTERALVARERQQSAVADLGRRALSCTDLQTLFDAAVSSISDVLGVDYCKVMELCPERRDLLLRAGIGWHSGIVGHAKVDAMAKSQAGYTLATNDPVIVDDLRIETRFSGPALLLDHAVISGLSCVIAGPGGSPWGVLGAHTRQRRSFNRDDVNFVTAIANILAAVIERQHFTQALHEREADLNRAQQVGHIGSWRLDRRRNRLTWSAENHRIFGIPEGTPLSYEAFLDTVHPDDRDYVDRSWQASLQGEPYTIEHRLWVDGRVKWVSERAELELDRDGTVIGAFGVTQDITERKKAERDQEKLLRMIEASGDFIAVADLEGRVTYTNAGARRMLGLGPEDDLGSLCFGDCVPPASKHHFLDTVIPSARDRGYWEGEMQVQNQRTGALIDVHRHVFLIHDPATGEPWCYGTVTRDISEQKRNQEALRDADRRKDEFLATLAHELRNPLAPIGNAVEILKLRAAPDPMAQSAREMIDRQVRHMVRLIDDLLDVSRITRGKLHLHCQRVSLEDVLRQALESSGPHLERAGHHLAIELPPEPVELDADPVRLAQVFLNLVNNASKYTEPGGHIRLGAERKDDEVAVRVRDTGVGIAHDDLPRLFEMFSQVGKDQERSRGGLGIGLSLARSLVEMHGGRIEAHSEGIGMGSTFTVWLPVADSAAAEPALADARNPVAAAARRILVVDDSEDNARSLAVLLRLSGNRVKIAYDGVEAIDVAERFRPDVILLDIGMPKLDGHGACRRIRKQDWGRDVVIIALTGWGQEEDRRKSREAGFDGHLVKPIATTALLEALDEKRAHWPASG